MRLEINLAYAFRHHPYALGEAAHPVRVIRFGPPKTRKVRVRWLDGEYEGLDEWVAREKLICLWEDAEPYLEEERCFAKALHVSPDCVNTAPWHAARFVLWNTPGDSYVDLGSYARCKPLLRIEDFESGTSDIGVDRDYLLTQPGAFVDRCGNYWAPFQVAEWLARFFCARHPVIILRAVERDEEKERTRVAHDPWAFVKRHEAEKYLLKCEETWALIREWCGAEACNAFDRIRCLESEIERLHGMVKKAADMLSSAGAQYRSSDLKGKATKLLRELSRSLIQNGK